MEISELAETQQLIILKASKRKYVGITATTRTKYKYVRDEIKRTAYSGNIYSIG
jgi:hypothetical protein